jgi:hypothetical protein
MRSPYVSPDALYAHALYNAILGCANDPTTLIVIGVPGGRTGSPNVLDLAENPAPGTTVTVNAN